MHVLLFSAQVDDGAVFTPLPPPTTTTTTKGIPEVGGFLKIKMARWKTALLHNCEIPRRLRMNVACVGVCSFACVSQSGPDNEPLTARSDEFRLRLLHFVNWKQGAFQAVAIFSMGRETLMKCDVLDMRN